MGDLSPWEALPDGEANGDGRIEVTTGSRTTGDNGKCDTKREAPADLENAAESRNAKGRSRVEIHGSNRRNAGENCTPCTSVQGESHY